MELRDLAERALFGTSLEDKLVRPARLTDGAPGVPLRGGTFAPGRPEGLLFEGASSRPKLDFPGPKELATDRGRGLALHFFANHELLAIELMALALLRFPGAPPAFRRGVARTLLEEQEHMALYRSRMAKLGVAFGEAPVSDFFWQSLSRMESPLDFVVGMGLTFEQANLDFALHYAGLFERAGDPATAALMRRVYDDEVGHVRHGLAWFREWKGEGSDWDCYVAALPEGLAPSRAKGRPYSREARADAGFDPGWIESLALCSRSKGRPPRVWFFRPTVEMEWAAQRRGLLVREEPPGAVRDLERDFAGLTQFLAAHDDVVVTEAPPSAPFLSSLAACGFETPEFVTPAEVAGRAFRARKLGRVVPWGWSGPFAREQAPLVAACVFPSHGMDAVAPRFSDKTRVPAIEADILASAGIAGLPAVVDADFHRGIVVRSLEGIRDAIASRPSVGRWVLKAPLSSSGRERVFLSGVADLDSPAGPSIAPSDARAVAWATQAFERLGALCLEPWLERVADLSVQATVDEGGGLIVHGVTRFACDDAGRYLGTALGRRGTGLPPEVIRFLHGNPSGRGVTDLLEEVGEAVGRRAASEGYVGALGVDAFLYRHPERGLALRPVVEINARCTMGRVALGIGARVAPGITALWLHLTTREMGEPPASFAARAAGAMGLSTSAAPGPLFKAGFLPTNDPSQARRYLSVLVGGPSPAALLASAHAVSPAFGALVGRFFQGAKSRSAP